MFGMNKIKILSISLAILISVFVTTKFTFAQTKQQSLEEPTPTLYMATDEQTGEVQAATTQETQTPASSIFKDTDLDGLSDEAEKNLYHTKIDSEDSDKDGILDAQEILDGTDPNDAASSLLRTYKMAANSPLQKGAPIMWYVGRISGIAAFIMFTLVICMGLLMTSKILVKFPFFSAPNALETHSFNATFVAIVLALGHGLSFMFDDIIKLKANELFIPFVVQRDLKSSLGWELGIPISLGIIAFYMALILVLTSQFRRKIVPVKIWRLIHYTSFLFYIVFLTHGIITGTDTKEGWMIAIYVTSVTMVLGLLLLRIFGKKYFLPTPKPITPSNVQTTEQSQTSTTALKDTTTRSPENTQQNTISEIRTIHG